jgi:tetratricopeptide (TPR) repeat protein
MREHAAEGPAPAATEEAVAPAPAAPLAQLTPPALLALQRRAGNRATTALLAREAATAAGPRTLAMWTEGPEVTRLQMNLNLLDEVKTALAVDAIYGPITTKAVKEFQSAHPPLKATGAADAGTQAAIAEAVTEEQRPEDIGRKLFTLGGNAYEKGKYGHAYAFFTRAYELAPRDNLLFSRAQALRRLGARREEAIALYEAYLATDNPSRKADAEAALAELTTSPTGDKAADTATGKAHFNKGAALYEQGDYAHAYDQFTMAGELAPRDNLLFSRAQALRRLGGRREEAIALYEAYLATDNPSRKADAEAALAELRTSPTGVEAADTVTARAHFNKGGGFYERGDYAHAYDQFTMAHELAPRDNLLFSRAQALRRLGGREAEAMALYEAYIETGGSRVEDAKLMLEVLRTHGAAP